ncbi:MAG TPA: hypothetical protein VGO11_14475 [Chthoniobacteraceae bacterium]|jgi:hypothetical protein|nr:hypothetical protein [Chthoniobacteraceae bacterium]
MKLLLFFTLLATMLGTAPAAEPARLPQKLSLYIGHYGPGGRTHVDLVDGALRYKVVKSQKETVETITPTAEQWTAFGLALDALKVWDWKKTYEIPSEDGTQWSATIIEEGHRLESTGNNAYPPDFKKYLAAVKALLGGRQFD